MSCRIHPAAVLEAAAGLLALACSSSQPTPRTQATSAEIAAAGSTDLRTLDNTGYVGPAGQTRSVTAGMGPVEVGRSEGVPPPQRERPAGGEVTASGPVSPSPPGVDEPLARAARALCDRETFCGRIGQGQTYGSADACMADKRDRITRLAPAKACGNAIRGDRLATCLAAIRAASCEPRDAPMQPPRACTAEELCD